MCPSLSYEKTTNVSGTFLLPLNKQKPRRKKKLKIVVMLISQVVRAFDALGEDISDLSNGMKPGQSEVYDSAEQNAQIRMFHRMAFGSQEVSTDFSERSHSQSRWASREHGDRTQTQTSFGSRDNNSGYQPQRSWTNREQENHNSSAKNANPLAGFWDT